MATETRGEGSPGTRPAATFKTEGGGGERRREVDVKGGGDHRCRHRVDFVSTSSLDMPTLATDQGVRGKHSVAADPGLSAGVNMEHILIPAGGEVKNSCYIEKVGYRLGLTNSPRNGTKKVQS